MERKEVAESSRPVAIRIRLALGASRVGSTTRQVPSNFILPTLLSLICKGVASFGLSSATPSVGSVD